MAETVAGIRNSLGDNDVESLTREQLVILARYAIRKSTQIAAQQKAYHAANPEKSAAWSKKYQETHKEKIAAIQRASYLAHKEERAAYAKAYYNAHKAEIAAQQRSTPERLEKRRAASRDSQRRRRAAQKRGEKK